jgi:hypothetical protein
MSATYGATGSGQTRRTDAARLQLFQDRPAVPGIALTQINRDVQTAFRY